MNTCSFHDSFHLVSLLMSINLDLCHQHSPSLFLPRPALACDNTSREIRAGFKQGEKNNNNNFVSLLQSTTWWNAQVFISNTTSPSLYISPNPSIILPLLLMDGQASTHGSWEELSITQQCSDSQCTQVSKQSVPSIEISTHTRMCARFRVRGSDLEALCLLSLHSLHHNVVGMTSSYITSLCDQTNTKLFSITHSSDNMPNLVLPGSLLIANSQSKWASMEVKYRQTWRGDL